LAGVRRETDVTGGKCLGDRNEKDVGRKTVRPFGRRRDAAPNGREVIGDVAQRGLI
jgi:hypothetical protein